MNKGIYRIIEQLQSISMLAFYRAKLAPMTSSFSVVLYSFLLKASVETVSTIFAASAFQILKVLCKYFFHTIQFPSPLFYACDLESLIPPLIETSSHCPFCPDPSYQFLIFPSSFSSQMLPASLIYPCISNNSSHESCLQILSRLFPISSHPFLNEMTTTIR